MISVIVIAAILMACAPFTPLSTYAMPARPKDKTEIVMRHVDNYFTAMRSGDLATIDLYLADDYTVIGRDGKFEIKSQRMDWLRDNMKYLVTVTPSEIKVRVYANAAVVTGLVTIQGEGAEPESHERFIQMWVERGAKWRMVAGQITTVTRTSSALLPSAKRPSLVEGQNSLYLCQLRAT